MKKLRKKLTWSSIFFVLVCLFTACSVSKQTISLPKSKVKGFEQAYKSVITNNLPPKLQLKYKLTAQIGDKTKNLSGTIKYLNDSVLWINIVSKAIGIELFRLKCTPDTLFFIDRINKKHYVGNYSLLKKQFGVDVNYYFLRSVLFGKAYGLSFDYTLQNINLFKNKKLKSSNFYFEYDLQNIDKQDYSKIKNPDLQNNFTVNKYGLLLENNYKQKSKFTSLQISDYKYNKQNFPNSFTINVTQKAQTIKLNFFYTEFNFKDVSINYKVPKSYEKVIKN